MPKKKPISIKAKSKAAAKPFTFWRHTVDETRAIQLFMDAFGKLTYYRDFPNIRQYIGMGRRCPECDTRFNEGDWPRCGWCHWSAAAW